MSVLWGGASVYGLAVGLLYIFQDNLIFPRGAASVPAHPLPDPAETIELQIPDGHLVVGHLVRARKRSRGLLIGFPGNAWNATDCTVFLAKRIDDFDIAVFHYRGYAPSG